MANGIDPTNPKKFKYTLDIRGVDDEVLFNSPSGWLETTIKYSRSKSYGGLIRSLTLPLKFVTKGAYLLRREFYVYGLLSRVNLKIEKLVNHTWQYALMYFGKLDFSKFSDDQVSSVTINAIEKTPSIQIDAFEDTDYAIPLDVDKAFKVKLNPLELTETADFIYYPSNDTRSDAFFILNIVSNNQMATQASVQGSGFVAINNPDFSTSNQWFYIARTDTNVSVSGKIEGEVITHDPDEFEINFYKSDGTLVKTVYNVSLGGFGSTAFSIEFNFSTDLIEDQRLFCFFRNVTSSNTNVGFQIVSGSLSLSYNTKSPASMCTAVRALYVYEQLIALMNGQEEAPVVTQSKLLTTTLKQLAITCSNSILASQLGATYQAGDSLQIGASYQVIVGSVGYFQPNGVARTFVATDPLNNIFKGVLGHSSFTTTDGGYVRQIRNNPQIIINWKDFFQSVYAIMGGNAGFGLDQGKACLEELGYFYRQGLKALDLSKNITANSFKLTPNTDFSFNTLKVGYSDQQYDFLNGTQEVNSEQNYTTTLTSPKNELNLISPIRADAYGIEAIRIIPANVDTNSAASKSDNDNFFLWIKPEPEIGQTYYQPLTVAEAATTYSGIDGSYYNFMLSPKHNLNRGKPFLASVLDKMSGYKITLTSALKNANMVVTVDGKTVSESAAINISDLGAPIFLPYDITFNTALEFNALELLDVSPYGEVWLKYLNVQYKGFISEIGIDVAQNSSQDFKLLLTPWNKTGNFIR